MKTSNLLPFPKPRKIFLNKSENKISLENKSEISVDAPYSIFDVHSKIQTPLSVEEEFVIIDKPQQNSLKEFISHENNSKLSSNSINETLPNQFDNCFPKSKLDNKSIITIEKETSDSLDNNEFNFFFVTSKPNDYRYSTIQNSFNSVKQYSSLDDLFVNNNFSYSPKSSFTTSMNSSFTDINFVLNLNDNLSNNFIVSSTTDQTISPKLNTEILNDFKNYFSSMDNFQTDQIYTEESTEQLSENSTCSPTMEDNHEKLTIKIHGKIFNRSQIPNNLENNFIYEIPNSNPIKSNLISMKKTSIENDLSKEIIQNQSSNGVEFFESVSDENLKNIKAFQNESQITKLTNNSNESQNRDDSFWVKVCNPQNTSENNRQRAKIFQFKKNKTKNLNRNKFPFYIDTDRTNESTKGNSTFLVNETFWDDIFKQYDRNIDESSKSSSVTFPHSVSPNKKLPPPRPPKPVPRQNLSNGKTKPTITQRKNISNNSNKVLITNSERNETLENSLPMPAPRTKFLVNTNELISFNNFDDSELEPDIKSFDKPSKSAKYKKLNKFKKIFKKL